MKENIEFSENWLFIRYLKQQKENPNATITIKLTDLFKLIIKFIRLNRKYAKESDQI